MFIFFYLKFRCFTLRAVHSFSFPPLVIRTENERNRSTDTSPSYLHSFRPRNVVHTNDGYRFYNSASHVKVVLCALLCIFPPFFCCSKRKEGGKYTWIHNTFFFLGGIHRINFFFPYSCSDDILDKKQDSRGVKRKKKK